MFTLGASVFLLRVDPFSESYQERFDGVASHANLTIPQIVYFLISALLAFIRHTKCPEYLISTSKRIYSFYMAPNFAIHISQLTPLIFLQFSVLK